MQADATTRATQMRGSDGMQEGLFTLAKLDDFVPGDHPLRAIRVLVNEALAGLNELFNSIYADSGRASIAPEKLLRAMLIQVFFSVRSERPLMEQVRYNLLFRWFIGLAMDDEVWAHSVFSKNRNRLLEHAVVERFFTEVMRLADQRKLLSKEHFSVDATRASFPSMAVVRMPVAGERAVAIRRKTGRASRAATTRMPAQLIPTRGCSARAATTRQSWPTKATC